MPHRKWLSSLDAMEGNYPTPTSIFPIPQYAVDDGAQQNKEYVE